MKKKNTPTPSKHKASMHADKRPSRAPLDNSHNVASMFAHALAQHQTGRLEEARSLYEQILARNGSHIDTLNCLGMLHLQNGRFQEGGRLLRISLEINADQPVVHMNLGNALKDLGQRDEALISYDRAIALNPALAQAHFNRGNTLNELQRMDEALASYDRAIALKPDYAQAHFNRGNTLKGLGRQDEALASFDRAIAIKPDYAEAYHNRSHVLNALKRIDEALASCDRVIALIPNFPDAHYNRGNALQELRRLSEAVASYDRAISLQTNHAEALCNRGNALRQLDRPHDALASYERAIALMPDYAEAYNNRGNVLQDLNRYHEAMASYDKALDIKPDLAYALGSWLHSKMHCCDWTDIVSAYEKVFSAVDLGDRATSPFFFLATPSSLEQQQHCAEIYIQDKYPESSSRPWQGEPYVHDRVRIGYLSADFHNHATAYLIAELLERHDHSKFEIIGISFGPTTNDAWQQRLEKSFDQFFNVKEKSDQEIATLLHKLEIDIAIDLKGHTQGARTGVFALRSAPLQLNYLGYPGTLGANYIDYVVADPTLIPPEHRQYYNEKVIYLPDSYQVNDSTKTISDRAFTRSELQLPEDAFVFCCFNNSYKITPDLFDIWMRLLREVDGSILWLLEGDAAAIGNLRIEAERRGIPRDRLVFAPRMELADHLARHRQADLFLDTFYYNAHTTASDALWAGLPVLTCLGHTFAGRVAASLLNAVDLPEMITHSHSEYESLALELATQPERLAAIRHKLAANRTAKPLFDTARFTRHIEAAYIRIYERHRSGLPPEHIVIGA